MRGKVEERKWEGEKGRERGREKDRETERETERDRERQREREREGGHEKAYTKILETKLSPSLLSHKSEQLIEILSIYKNSRQRNVK